MEKHIENIRKFNIEPVVAINNFVSDSLQEVDFVIEKCQSLGVKAVVSKGWEKGGEGTKKLARAVVDVVENNVTQYKPLYDWKSPVKYKIETIAKKIYGAKRLNIVKKHS